MADLMPKKNYDLTEITRLLLEMRENCIPKAGNAYEDPNRAEKYDALNAAIDLINNPSMVQKWKSVKDEPPKEWKVADGTLINYLVYMPEYGVDVGNYLETAKTWVCMGLPVKVTHWMPLPEPPKYETPQKA